MQIAMSNQNNKDYEAEFDSLIQEVFGFSFAPWLEKGLWDERYESYSILENGRMLANLCIFKTDMLVNGKPVRAHQLGGVAVRKSERGKGYARQLLEYVLNQYPDTPAYLAANPDVRAFYPRFGFRQIQTYVPRVSVPINQTVQEAQKLSPDHPMVTQALNNRRYSSMLDSINSQSVRMFHLLLDYLHDIYYLPNIETVVVAKQTGESLFIADVLASTPITFDEISRELPFIGVRDVEFGFCPEHLNVSPEWEPVDQDTHPFFIRGEWDLPPKFCFPTLAET